LVFFILKNSYKVQIRNKCISVYGFRIIPEKRSEENEKAHRNKIKLIIKLKCVENLLELT
jgi:hypothetical protein